MLEIINVSKKYKNGTIALQDINVTVRKGEKIALFGENGAGKTTLLKIVATFLIPDNGNVLLDGVDLLKHEKYARKNVSISTGVERSFYYRLNVRQNLEFFGRLNGLYGEKLQIVIDKVIEETDLKDFEKVKYMELSKGLKRRLDIARAIMKDSEIYIFDEPTAGVDLKTRQSIYNIVEELIEKDKIIFFATHEIEELKKMHKIIVLKKGRKIGEINTNDYNKIEEILLNYI
ncbi:multidrug ABC transporter ATP-binding protein [Thermosipho sp. 1063]|uniref:ABC transporter ATP-binding protein n=1 Tax=unclassified Thermosipho (in: thermotogales) TaxID=2676525 RepID=UPI000950B6AA|nr:MULTISPECIES: ATP-binding cassette domain-containing protein [unclassified Thermosipho (in: thermotogales)]APT72884.1 multidrug ABC transporter ATP-binding protein [Thermosipho sp. 1063]OOC42318.1 multidrug ABC transporter ATP-binding protein [Thermosipho sp. 1074]